MFISAWLWAFIILNSHWLRPDARFRWSFPRAIKVYVDCAFDVLGCGGGYGLDRVGGQLFADNAGKQVCIECIWFWGLGYDRLRSTVGVWLKLDRVFIFAQ